MVNFARTFSLDMPCESVRMTKTRQVYHEPEPGIWMVMVRVNNNEVMIYFTSLSVDGECPSCGD